MSDIELLIAEVRMLRFSLRLAAGVSPVKHRALNRAAGLMADGDIPHVSGPTEFRGRNPHRSGPE